MNTNISLITDFKPLLKNLGITPVTAEERAELLALKSKDDLLFSEISRHGHGSGKREVRQAHSEVLSAPVTTAEDVRKLRSITKSFGEAESRNAAVRRTLVIKRNQIFATEIRPALAKIFERTAGAIVEKIEEEISREKLFAECVGLPFAPSGAVQTILASADHLAKRFDGPIQEVSAPRLESLLQCIYDLKQELSAAPVA